MNKDKVFWMCMVLNFMVMFLVVLLKPQIHLLPTLMMHIIIKLQIFLQLASGVWCVWLAVTKKSLYLFSVVYGILVFIYLLIKIPTLAYLQSYYTIERDLFTPFPFIVIWIVDKAFYQINPILKG